MLFDDYFEKIQDQITQASSLEDLIIRRQRISVGSSRLPYKVKGKYLYPHHYNKMASPLT